MIYKFDKKEEKEGEIRNKMTKEYKSKDFWEWFILMIALIIMIKTYDNYTGFVYWLKVVIISIITYLFILSASITSNLKEEQDNILPK
ncbi:hypothetical protein GF336_07825 [Candidatus Woesearchaeota archaeon]|nr:hypothetical protein [Candidatus Woesearchaeota archaeon]